MKINQVEELVGITKKNIRFYEDQGLLNPERNPENGYRNYSLNDVDLLLKIKLLRKLSVPIEEIRQVMNGRLQFKECMDKHMIRLNHEQHSLEVVKQLCTDISENVTDLSNLNAGEYLDNMCRMEEGGTLFMNIEKNDINRKKTYGSLIAACSIIILMIIPMVVVLWCSSISNVPVGAVIVVCVLSVGTIAGIMVVLRQRLYEIKGGEEDEARKY